METERYTCICALCKKQFECANKRAVQCYLRPTPESIAKEQARQEVISTLTPEQRKALGL